MTIVNKETEGINLPDGDSVKRATYVDLIRIVLGSPVKGYSMDDILQRSDIRTSLKSSTDTEINLEKSEIKYLQKLIKSPDFIFPFDHDELKEFFETLRDLK